MTVKKFVIEPTMDYSECSFPRRLRNFIDDCSTIGSNDCMVEEWAKKFKVEKEHHEFLAKYLKEYGTWDDEELSNYKDNLQRLVWLMAHDINEQDEFLFSH